MRNIYIFLALLVLSSCNVDDIHTSGIIDLNESKSLRPEEYTQKESKPFKQAQNKPKTDLVEIYTGFIGVRELTGKNDGYWVERWLKHEGLGKGNPYCASFVSFCLDSAGFKNNITAWSPTAFDKTKVVYKGEWKREFKQGQVFTLYYSNLKRIGHTGFAHQLLNEKIIETVEANTNGEGSREGSGVFKKKRSLHTIYAICEFR